MNDSVFSGLKTSWNLPKPPESLKLEILKPIAKAFTQSMRRLDFLSSLPFHAFQAGAEYRRDEVEASIAVLGKPFPSTSDWIENHEKIEEQRLIARANRASEGVRMFSFDLILMELAPFVVQPAIESLIGTCVIGAWSAFEILAGDMWVACLDTNASLGLVALGAEPEADDNDETIETKRKKKYELRLNLLRKYDFNLKNRMGTILRGKWDFASRLGAYDAYAKTFGKKCVLVLKAIFHDEKMQWLAALRNVIIHNGGVADDGFLPLVQRHPVFGKLKEKRSRASQRRNDGSAHS